MAKYWESMMKIKFALIILAMTIISGCGPVYNTSYTYEAPQGIQAKQCIIQCQQARTLCQSACSSENNQCEQSARENASFQYQEYVSHQRRSGKPVTRELSSFYSDYNCNQNCGQCTVQFNDCYSMCGGKVLVHKKCVAFCGKQG